MMDNENVIVIIKFSTRHEITSSVYNFAKRCYHKNVLKHFFFFFFFWKISSPPICYVARRNLIPSYAPRYVRPSGVRRNCPVHWTSVLAIKRRHSGQRRSRIETVGAHNARNKFNELQSFKFNNRNFLPTVSPGRFVKFRPIVAIETRQSEAILSRLLLIVTRAICRATSSLPSRSRGTWSACPPLRLISVQRRFRIEINRRTPAVNRRGYVARKFVTFVEHTQKFGIVIVRRWII